jgi:hypothetical protein
MVKSITVLSKKQGDRQRLVKVVVREEGASGCLGFVDWRVDGHPQIWQVIDLKCEMLEGEISGLWMLEYFLPFWYALDLMVGPPVAKFGACI